MIQVIFTCPSWTTGRRGSAATLAAELMQPVALRTMSLMDLFMQATVAGADPAEFRPVWGFSEFVRRIEAALQAGDLTAVQALLATVPVSLSDTTMAAVQQAIAANTLTRLQVNWPEFDADGNPAPPPPESVDAAWVEAQLTAAGYVWDTDAGRWERRNES